MSEYQLTHEERGFDPQLTPLEVLQNHVKDDKILRVRLDEILQSLHRVTDSTYPHTRKSRERSIVLTKLQEAIMWLGMDMKALRELGAGNERPYPSSYDPASPVVEPPAHGLKL